MILSRTSQYAIQALIFMATQPRGVPVLIRTVAEHLDVPPPYLAKIMQSLSRGKLIHSLRGRQGGVCLSEGGEKTDLMQILTLIEGPGLTDDCVLGLKVCGDETACPMHSQWKPIKTRIVNLLNQQTLGKLAAAVRSGKYRLTELPFAALGSMPTALGSKPEALFKGRAIRGRRAGRVPTTGA
ncbi:MAG: Rrf2 family transcriptional regulator [Burkholderiaceae bacterium]|nr:Rrf2 family transcriptional regulator [Sulfuritalea sp.]MCF8174660.1 Rrf2 family transcriptional regulator [Burkholderiaceae bacterium]